MFEHHLEDNLWKNQQGLVKVLNWKLYDSCGVHCVTMQNILYYMLVEKMYPLTKHTLHQMFNDVKLQVDYECEMTFELLRLVKKQLKEGYFRGGLLGLQSFLKLLLLSFKPGKFIHGSLNILGLNFLTSQNCKGSHYLGIDRPLPKSLLARSLMVQVQMVYPRLPQQICSWRFDNNGWEEEDFIMSSTEIVYRFEPREHLSKSTPPSVLT
ncbi:hypothetical protein Tco_0997368 [Tanacetum coccineum]